MRRDTGQVQQVVATNPDHVISAWEVHPMSKGSSIYLGLNAVDPNHYGGKYPLAGCQNDARDMAALARAAGFAPTVLLDSDATATRLLESLDSAARRLEAGDALLLTYSGHGAQVPDESGDEEDGL